MDFEFHTIPNGVDFNTATGELSGVPTIHGTFPLTFTATPFEVIPC